MTNIDPHLMVVNKTQHFKPQMLEKLEFEPIDDEDGKTYIEKDTLKAFEDLQEYLHDKYDMFLSLTSAGRTPETQQKVLEEQIAQRGEKALETTAKPGESEHHTGLALDVIPHSKFADQLINLAQKVPKKIRGKSIAPIKNILYANLHKSLEQFGFILRYTKDKQEITGYPAERWHIRYVGKEYAKEMNQKNMCLEEYVEFIKANNANLAANLAAESENS